MRAQRPSKRASLVDPNGVQSRVTGTCPVGQYLRGIAPNRGVVCEPLLTPPASTTTDDPASFVGFYTSNDSLQTADRSLPTIGALSVFLHDGGFHASQDSLARDCWWPTTRSTPTAKTFP